jgi:hypothetical protein
MQLDVRYPIGLLLTLYGLILAIQGLIAGAKVLGLNVNLYWGVVMTICGLTVLYFVKVRLKPDPTVSQGPDTTDSVALTRPDSHASRVCVKSALSGIRMRLFTRPISKRTGAPVRAPRQRRRPARYARWE